MGLGRWNIFGVQRTLHEATRRAWCRLAFVLCGVLPLLLTLVACVLEYVPWYQHLRAGRFAQHLQQLTGLVVHVERVELLTPSRRLLHGIELLHPETGEVLGRMSSVWISETPGGCAIKAQAPQLEADHLRDLADILYQQVLCRPTVQGHAVVLWMDGLVLSGIPETQFEFKQWRCEVRRSANSTTARLSFDRAGVAGSTAELTFARQHTDSIPTSNVTLDTRDQYLPGHWVHQFAPQFSIAGPDATIRGNFALEANQFGWALRGQKCRLQHVDATSWFDRPVISGLADVEIDSFAMTDSNLREITGQLLVQHGQMHTDLIRSAAYLYVHPSAQVQDAMQKIPNQEAFSFTKLGCKFSLDGRGLVLSPIIREAAIAIDEVGPILQYKIQPNSLLPHSLVVVFLSLKTKDSEILQSPTVKRLVQWLPGPQAAAARTARASNQ